MLHSAARLAAQSLDLDFTPTADWDQETRIQYVRRLAGIILQYPQSFTPETLASASIITRQNFTAMQLDDYVNAAPDGAPSLAKAAIDAAFDEGMAPALANVQTLANGIFNVIGSVGRIGTNLGQTGERIAETSASGWLLPVAVVAVVALIAINASKEVRRAVS